ncbi:MAG: heparinase II/III family protein [Armatimonadota bacterium]
MGRRTHSLIALTALVATVVIVTAVGLNRLGHAQEEGNMTGLLQHPCVLINAETLAELRVKAADGGVNRFGFAPAEVWQELLAQADGFLTAEPYHYRVNIQQDPANPPVMWEYTLSDQTPPRHPGINYPPWTAMTQEQRDDAITVRLKSLSFAYLVTGDARYAQAAKTIAMHLAHWEWWSDPDYGGGIACLDTGHITKCMGLFYDWCFGTLSRSERAFIREAIIDKGCAKIVAGIGGYPPETNGWAVLTSGLACAALAVRPEDARGGLYLGQAIEFTRRSLDLSGRDGGQFEGPMYGTYLLDSLAHVFDAVMAAQVETDLLEHPFLATMDEYVISQMTPDGHEMPGFGDGSPVRGYPETMSVLANGGDSAAAWYLEQIGRIKPATIHEFIRFDATALNPRQPSFNPSRPLVDVGLVALKAGYQPHTPYLCMKSGPPQTSVGHAHFDSNAIVLSFLGEWLIADRGYRARHNPPAEKFTGGTMGHSTLVLDIDDAYMQDTTQPSPGHDQVNRAGARIEQFFSCDVLDYVRGEAAPTYNSPALQVLDSFARQIFYLKPDCYVIVDDVAAPEAHEYTITLQAAPNSAIEQVEGNTWAIQGMRAELLCFLASPQGLSTADAAYPGAEQYGRFIRATTPRTRSARLVTLLYPQVLAEGGMLQNAGFERGMTGWRPRANEDLPNHVIDDQVARSGRCSGRIDRSGYYYGPRFPVQPGQTVRVQAWARTANTTEDGARLTIHFWDTSGKAFSTPGTEVVAPDDWTLLEVEAVAPDKAVEVDFGLYYSGEGSVWWDDAQIEIEGQEVSVVRPPISAVAPLDEGARGMTARVGSRQLALVTAGGPVEVAGETVEHDGAFAAMAFEGEAWRYLYLQAGTALSRQGEALLRADMDGPVSVAVWRGDEPGTVHMHVQASLEPHAPAVAARDVRLVLRSATPITRALVDGVEVLVARDGDRYSIG